MEFFYHCPDCGHDYATHADIESIEDVLNCTITCLCGRDILITDVDNNTDWVQCESIEYDGHIEI